MSINKQLNSTAMKTSKNTLDILVRNISILTNTATSKEEAIEKGLNKYMYLEYASCYGGYRLVNVDVKGGGHSGVMGMSGMDRRLKASEMEIQLRGIITGLQFANTSNLNNLLKESFHINTEDGTAIEVIEIDDIIKFFNK